MRSSSSQRTDGAVSLAPKKTKSTDSNIGTLWLMWNSPLSAVMKTMLRLSAREAHRVNFVPFLSTMTIYIRLLCHGIIPPLKLTVPILYSSATTDKQQPPQFFFDSLSIARYIDQHRHSIRDSLFPSDHMADIERFNDHAQTLLCYSRAKMISKLQTDMEALEALFAPKWLQGGGGLKSRILTRPLLRVALWLFSLKYSSESERATVESTRRSLTAVRNALMAHTGTDLRHLVAGRFTYADIIVAQLITFDPELYNRFAHIFGDVSLADEFADVVAWARAIRETHCLIPP